MTRQELELKAKEFESKLKWHPMISKELQKVLCDFVESLRKTDVSDSVCLHPFNEVYQDEKECYCTICGKDFTN